MTEDLPSAAELRLPSASLIQRGFPHFVRFQIPSLVQGVTFSGPFFPQSDRTRGDYLWVRSTRL